MKVVFAGKEMTYYVLPRGADLKEVEKLAEPVKLANGQVIVITKEKHRLEEIVKTKLQPMTISR